jgi:hypothetical protein
MPDAPVMAPALVTASALTERKATVLAAATRTGSGQATDVLFRVTAMATVSAASHHYRASATRATTAPFASNASTARTEKTARLNA